MHGSVIASDTALSSPKNYSKCPKISYTKIADKMVNANSADPDQEQCNLGLHYLPFH